MDWGKGGDKERGKPFGPVSPFLSRGFMSAMLRHLTFALLVFYCVLCALGVLLRKRAPAGNIVTYVMTMTV